MTLLPALPHIASEIDVVLRATSLLATTWVFAAVLRRTGACAAARHTAWLLGIVALLALPILWWLVPALHLPILPVEALTTELAADTLPEVAPVAATLTAPLPFGSPGFEGWRFFLVVAWALGSTALLLRLMIGRRVLSRLWREADAPRNGGWSKLLAQLSSELRLPRPVDLRISFEPVMPMTWGTLAPKVLLPAEASVWPRERLRLVLLHELAHVARRDSLSRSIASLACALYWFHPGAWFAARRMRLEQEHAADDRVLTAGGRAQVYALTLLQLAKRIGTEAHPDLAATMAGMGQLERRLVSIITPTRRDRQSTVFISFATLLAALATLGAAIGVPVGASSPLRASIQSGATVIASGLGAETIKSEVLKPRSNTEAQAAVVSVTRNMSRDARRQSTSESTGAQPLSPADTIGTVDGSSATPRMISRELGLNSLGEEQRQGQRQAPAYSQQVPDYGWKLTQRASEVEIADSSMLPRAPRLPSIASPDPVDKERTARPKWAQVVPQVTPAGSPRDSSPLASPGPLTLSWSVALGGK